MSSTTTLDSIAQETWLIGISSGSWCDIYPLRKQRRVNIGRAGKNRITIQDEKCSRLHCQVFWKRDAWFLSDAGSRNGTYLNGKKITGTERLKPGDRIRVTSRELMFTDTLDCSVDSSCDEPSVDRRSTQLESPTDGLSDAGTELNLKHDSV